MDKKMEVKAESFAKEVRKVHLVYLNQMIEDIAVNKYIVRIPNIPWTEEFERSEQEVALGTLILSINTLSKELDLTDEEKEHLIMTTDQLERYRQTHPMVQNFSPSATERYRRHVGIMGVFEELKSRWSR